MYEVGELRVRSQATRVRDLSSNHLDLEEFPDAVVPILIMESEGLLRLEVYLRRVVGPRAESQLADLDVKWEETCVDTACALKDNWSTPLHLPSAVNLR